MEKLFIQSTNSTQGIFNQCRNIFDKCLSHKLRINKTIFSLCIQLNPYFFLCFSFWKSEHRKILACSNTSWFHVCLLSSNLSDVYVGLLILYSILTNVNLKIATARICQYSSNNPLKHEGKYFVLLYYHWTQYLHCFK